MNHFRRHILLYGTIFVLSVLLFLRTQTYITALRSLLIDAGLVMMVVIALLAVINWLLNKAVENNNARVDALELSSELLLERVDARGFFLLAAGLLGFVVGAYGWSQADIFHQYFTWPFVLLLTFLLSATGSYECLRAARRLTLSAKRQVWLDIGEYAFYTFNFALFVAAPAIGYCVWIPDSSIALLLAGMGLIISSLSYVLLLGIGFYNCLHFWWTWIKTNHSAKSFLEHHAIKG